MLERTVLLTLKNCNYNILIIILQREQLAQKLDKRKRARKYRIIKAASGSKFPIGHGCGVFFHPLCTDEPRIKLDVDDIVIVTRWKKYAFCI